MCFVIGYNQRVRARVSPMSRLGLGVRDRGGDGLLYSPPRLFSTKYACGPSSLHDPGTLLMTRIK